MPEDSSQEPHRSWRRPIESITEHRAGVFQKREEDFLFHLVSQQAKQNWHPIPASSLRELCGVPTRMTEHNFVQAAADLQRYRWPPEEHPYIRGLKRGYARWEETFITLDRTAAVAVELMVAPGGGGHIIEREFRSHLMGDLHMTPIEVKEDIAYLLRHWYVERSGDANCIYPLARLYFEEGYLRRLAQVFTPRIVGPPSATPMYGVLKREEVDCLELIWKAQHFERRPGVTLAEISGTLGITEADAVLTLEDLGAQKRNMIQSEDGEPPLYRIVYQVVGWPPTARMLCELIGREHTPPKRDEYLNWLSYEFLRQHPDVIEERHLGFAQKCGYIEEAPYNTGCILASRRAREHRPYLERISEMLDEWLVRNSEGQRWKARALEWRQTSRPLVSGYGQHHSIPSAPEPAILGWRVQTDFEAALLLRINQMEHETGTLVSIDEIATRMNSPVPKVVDTVRELLNWPWEILAPKQLPDAEGKGAYRLAFEKVIGWPSNAALIQEMRALLKHPTTLHHRVAIVTLVEHMVSKFPSLDSKFVKDKLIDFAVKTGYLKVQPPTEAYLWFDNRAEAEEPYLRLLAAEPFRQ